MIILLEDRKERKKQFISNDELFPLIIEKPLDCSNLEKLGGYLKENYSEAKVILLHKSYEFKNHSITPENFKVAARKVLHIPVVLFSGGSNSNLIQEKEFVTAEVNSGVMYRNLHLFHDEYQRTGIPNIPLLIYGVNYRLNQLMEMQAKTNIYFFDRSYSDKLNENDVEELRDITDMVKDEQTKEKIEKMWEWIIKDKGIENVSINTMQTLIQRTINQQ